MQQEAQTILALFSLDYQIKDFMTTGYLDNYYARLGVPRTATQEEIRNAYHQAARKFHPDTNKDSGATDVFLNIQEAYETLSNPEKRDRYDKVLPKDVTGSPKNTLVNTIYSRQALPIMDSPQLIYVMLNLMALPPGSGALSPTTPPLNICLVLDTSTSMSGPRLNTVKETARQIIQTLKPEDVISVVTFNDAAEVIIPATRGQNINILEARISIMSTDGGTEIYKGLKAGLTEMMRNLRPSYHNHIILVTDGRTYGDEEACLGLAEQAADAGITIHALGIGDKWNDVFLDELSTKTGGGSEFAETSRAIEKFLKEKFGQIQDTFASNVTLDYTTPPGVELRYAFRLSPDSNSITLGKQIALGDIPNRHSLSIIMEFLIDGIKPEQEEFDLINGKLNLVLPKLLIPNVSTRLSLSRPTTKKAEPEPPPQVLVRAMSKLSLYRLQEMAQKDLEAGNIVQATQRLKNLATQLLDSGEEELANTVMLEINNVNSAKSMNEEAKKRIKYGTRALVLEKNVEVQQ
jgi:Ca-activated chloride channel family protein